MTKPRKTNRRKLTIADVSFDVYAEPENDIEFRGSFDSGDAEQDEQTACEIIESHNAGNAYAWCTAVVAARWTAPDGTKFDGTDTLGGVSCLRDEARGMSAHQCFEELVKDHGMHEQALEALQAEVDAYDRREAEHEALASLARIPLRKLAYLQAHGSEHLAAVAKHELRRRALVR